MQFLQGSWSIFLPFHGHTDWNPCWAARFRASLFLLSEYWFALPSMSLCVGELPSSISFPIRFVQALTLAYRYLIAERQVWSFFLPPTLLFLNLLFKGLVWVPLSFISKCLPYLRLPFELLLFLSFFLIQLSSVLIRFSAVPLLLSISFLKPLSQLLASLRVPAGAQLQLLLQFVLVPFWPLPLFSTILQSLFI